MRSISTAQNAILTVAGAQGGAQKFLTRLRIKDAGGVWRDLTSYALGVNLLKSVSWKEAVDDPGITFDATFIREQELLSLAPMMSTSALNHGFNPTSSAVPLVQVGRMIRVDWALHAEDDPLSFATLTATWVLAFTGFIDTVNSSGDGEMSISGRGMEAAIIDTYIERERVYAYAQGSNADRGCFIFEPLRAYFAGDRVIPTNANLNDHFYRVTLSGTSAATEPTWPTSAGGAVISGGAQFTESGATSTTVGTNVETVMQQALTDNGLSVTLQCPVSPAWLVKWFMIGRQPLFDELRALADQIGWAIRYVWDSSQPDPTTGSTGGLNGDLRLRLYDPNRSTTTSVRTFSKGDQLDIKRAEVQIFDIRNVVTVIYSDSQDLDTAGFPKRKSVTVTDSSSITKYGRRFCEISESSSSNIDTSAEATVLANAVLSDLKEPSADFELETRCFPFVENTDLVTVAANGVHMDTNQKLAVVGYEHSQSADDSTSTIRVRGKPSTGKSTWLQMATDGKNGELHALTALDTTVAAGAAQTGAPVGGASGGIAWNGSKYGRDTQYELHLSTTSGFTPSAGTLKTVSSERSYNLGDLDPSQTYYGVYIPIVWNGRKRTQGLQSAQFTITPGRAAATHLNPEVVWGRLPLNGGFETSLDPSQAPDFWVAVSWGTREFLLSDDYGLSGSNYVKLVTTDAVTAANITSAIFPIDNPDGSSAATVIDYAMVLTLWRKNVSGSGNNLRIQTIYFDYKKVTIGSPTNIDWDIATNVGSWEKVVGVINPPVGARFCQVGVSVRSGASGREVHIDSIDARHLYAYENGASWVSGTLINSWVAFGGVYPAPRYQKDFLGWVTLSGLAKSGTVGASMFTLPAGFRPATNAHVYQIVVSNNAVGVVEVKSNGDVLVQAGSNVHFSLEGVRFPAGN